MTQMGAILLWEMMAKLSATIFYNRNDVEDYLYNNTRFERGSRTRHHYGKLYRENDGKVYIKLNLQIRFLQ